MMTLTQFLIEKCISQQQFAARVGVRQGTISRLTCGAIRPSLQLAAKIERETGGLVPAVSWVPDDPVESDPQKDVA